MKLIQLILIPSILIFMVIYFRRFRTLLVDRLLVLGLCLVTAALVVRPEWSVVLAKALGVGRGVDLLFYLGFVGVSFFCLMLWSKQRDLDARLTEIARTQAMDRARDPQA
ncbi:MAG: DUF2304 domain-containing protein [Candidatus Omnitrophota bacterium]|jgi:hypothetical protein